MSPQPFNMATAAAAQQSFRFLDLPAELRCHVYGNIELSTTWHTLDRTQALLNKRKWPVPPLAQVYDSRINLIRPHTGTAINILATCHTVYEEACPILRRKIQHAKSQPVRYLVDYSAACALVIPSSALQSCLGVPDAGFSHGANSAVKSFVKLCTDCVSPNTHIAENATQSGAGLQDIPAVEMTITHKSDVVYGIEVAETLGWLPCFNDFSPYRLVVVYKSPLPKIRLRTGDEIRDSSDHEELILQMVPREPAFGEQGSIACRGTFVRPLGEVAFERHVEGLEFY